MMKPNHKILLPLAALIPLAIFNTSIVLMQHEERASLLNLIEHQDETIFNAIKCMAHPSDTAAINGFIRIRKSLATHK